MGDNGKNGWAKWLVGVLFTILFTAITTLTTAVVANDEKSRDRDTRIVEELRNRDMKMMEALNANAKEQMITNQQVLVTLARVEANWARIEAELKK